MLAGTLSTLGPLGVLAGVAGCSGEKGSEDAAQVTRAELRMRRDAARQSRELLARYEATAAAHTALADRLRPMRAATARHSEVLNGRAGKDKDGGGEREQDSGKAGGRKKPSVPAEEKAALAALGDLERRTAQERTDALVKAPPGLARVLASLAAAGAAHAYLLGADGGDGQDGDT